MTKQPWNCYDIDRELDGDDDVDVDSNHVSKCSEVANGMCLI